MPFIGKTLNMRKEGVPQTLYQPFRRHRERFLVQKTAHPSGGGEPHHNQAGEQAILKRKGGEAEKGEKYSPRTRAADRVHD